MQITIATQADADTKAAAYLLPVSETGWTPDFQTRTASRMGIADIKHQFSASKGQVFSTYSPSNQAIFLIGMGKNPDTADWFRTIRTFFMTYRQALPTHVWLDLSTWPADWPDDWLVSVVVGCHEGDYKLGRYQTSPRPVSEFYMTGTLVLQLPAETALRAETLLAKAEHIAAVRATVLDNMNAPANYLTPQALADWAVASGDAHGYSVEVWQQDALAQEGLGGLLSVGRGSENPPVLIVADYTPKTPTPLSLPTIGLVGKGVTFDTGGLSIKTSNNMHLMKSDMGGAAAVLGAIEAVARLQLPIRVVAVVPATENSVDARSTRPGDVITSYSGQTIEIIDTDAEGRVILADGITFLLRHYQPDVLIDVATLTGSVVATLGYSTAGLFSSSDELAQQLAAAGEKTGEHLWRFPLLNELVDDIRSDVADLKNYSGKPIAGAITAALFLQAFTEKHPQWAHLDIAGTAYGDNEFGKQKNATGFGVRLLVAFIESYWGLQLAG